VVGPCKAEVVYPMSDKEVVRAIIGEAIGESEEGIVAVAYVVKQRFEIGKDHGCCAYYRKDLDEFISRQPAKKVRLVKQIWSEVKQGNRNNPVPGAIYFENVKQWKRPVWCEVLVAEIGNHSFYREK